MNFVTFGNGESVILLQVRRSCDDGICYIVCSMELCFVDSCSVALT